jgi:hypothetical protein
MTSRCQWPGAFGRRGAYDSPMRGTISSSWSCLVAPFRIEGNLNDGRPRGGEKPADWSDAHRQRGRSTTQLARHRSIDGAPVLVRREVGVPLDDTSARGESMVRCQWVFILRVHPVSCADGSIESRVGPRPLRFQSSAALFSGDVGGEEQLDPYAAPRSAMSSIAVAST